MKHEARPALGSEGASLLVTGEGEGPQLRSWVSAPPCPVSAVSGFQQRAQQLAASLGGMAHRLRSQAARRQGKAGCLPANELRLLTSSASSERWPTIADGLQGSTDLRVALGPLFNSRRRSTLRGLHLGLLSPSGRAANENSGRQEIRKDGTTQRGTGLTSSMCVQQIRDNYWR